jgi:hypothetical protein
MSMSMRNPTYRGDHAVRHAGSAARPLVSLNAQQRAALRVAVAAVLTTLPDDQPLVTLHEIAVALRAAERGIAPDAFDGTTIADVLRELGHEVSI